jgi:prepilin-type N-terminal cleavage/methylation domain-containing protein
MRHGFSLVELSIVLVILGLLTGGILTGQNLIRAAELRGIVTDFNRYQTAAQTFRGKYFALPGDLTNATNFWGSAGGDGQNFTCLSAQTTAAPTCNGNGDGDIKHGNGGQHSERFLFWKHLANAGMVEGSYTGVTNGAINTAVYVIGQNVPAGRVPSSMFDANSVSTGTTLYAHDRTGQEVLDLVGIASPYGVITPAEAWGIDKKMDDGLPARGKVFTTINSSSYGGGCADDDTDDAEYDLQATDTLCTLMLQAF